MNAARQLVRSEPVRVYVYGLAAALVALLVVYGVLDGAQAAVWLAVVTAVVSVPLVEGARARVTPSPPAHVFERHAS